MGGYVTASLTAQNTFTDWITPKQQLMYGIQSPGFLDLVISGTWAGTITVQKRHGHSAGSGSTDITYTDAVDVQDFTANAVQLIEDRSATVQYRAGFKTGNYTSGTAAIRLEQ